MMAYMIGDEGPYPNKAGEHCGNHLVGSRPQAHLYESQEQADVHQREYLARLRFGRPRPCKAGTTAELISQGYVGLYLKKDQRLMSWKVECETPPELTEPEASEGE